MIELPDDQAAALTEKAAAKGMLLQEWLAKLALGKVAVDLLIGRGSSERPIWEVIPELMKRLPPEDLGAPPVDGGSQIDHYVCGVSRRDQ